MIQTRVGSAELDMLAEALATPCCLGAYVLEGLIRKTSTALIFVARGGTFGDGEGVMKLTGKEYAPLLERELGLLVRCREANVHGVVRPLRAELEWIDSPGIGSGSVATILLPFLSGGDLVQVVGTQATRTGQLGPHLALRVGEHVGGILRALLQMERPIVYHDVKPQNVLLPQPGALLRELTLIDMDVSVELETGLQDLAAAPREVAQSLIDDVHGFGELLYELATGSEPPVEGAPNPNTDNPTFNALVERCLTSELSEPGYVCLADNALWRDLEKALATDKKRRRADTRRPGALRFLLNRASLAVLGAILFVGLIVAVISKVLVL